MKASAITLILGFALFAQIAKAQDTRYMMNVKMNDGSFFCVAIEDISEVNFTKIQDNRFFYLEPPLVSTYLHDFIYDSSDYTYTNILKYTFVTTDYDKTKPFPVTLNWKLNDSNETKKIVCKVFDNKDVLVRTDSIEGSSENIIIYNLIPDKEYKYKLFYEDLDGLFHMFSCGSFYTLGQLRMINIDGMFNFRDLGGWPVSGGKRIKYDKLFRSAEPCRSNQGNITQAGINEIINKLGIEVELDFGDSSTESPLEKYLEFVHGDKYQILGYRRGMDPAAEAEGGYYTGPKYANCFNLILEKLKSNKKVMFHCNAGADRTGSLAFLLEGLLGVSESDLCKDFELTSFKWERTRNDNSDPINSYREFVSYIKKNFKGNSFNDKIIQMALSFGISQASINEFRALMLEDK